jgi:putative endonuclease
VPPESTENIGPQGEDLAARFVERLGWRVLVRNYWAGGAEIDLIARDGGEVVFVEVKTYSGEEFGEPAEHVEDRKQRQISRAAIGFVQRFRLERAPLRFDVIAVLLGPGGPRLEHFRDAFPLHRTMRA